jgi:hypothetical protein
MTDVRRDAVVGSSLLRRVLDFFETGGHAPLSDGLRPPFELTQARLRWALHMERGSVLYMESVCKRSYRRSGVCPPDCGGVVISAGRGDGHGVTASRGTGRPGPDQIVRDGIGSAVRPTRSN